MDLYIYGSMLAGVAQSWPTFVGPLTFANAADYDKIQPSDRISLLNLKDLKPGSVSCLQRLLLRGEVFLCLSFTKVF